MLAKEKRLNLKKNFKWVASGSRSKTDFITIFFRFGNNTIPKIGISLTKAAFKSAVERNRAKRLVSKAFEDLYGNLPASINIVAMPKGEVLELNPETIKVGIEGILKKQQLI